VKEFLVSALQALVPGPKALALVVVPALLMLDHKFKIGISDAKVITAGGVVAVYLFTHLPWFKKAADAATKVAALLPTVRPQLVQPPWALDGDQHRRPSAPCPPEVKP
jgi:hypothetical protein